MDKNDPEVTRRGPVGDRAEDRNEWESVPSNLRPARAPLWPYILGGFLFVIGAAVATVLIVPVDVPYYAYSPGPVNDVTDFVTIDDAAPEGTGELYFLTVALKEVNLVEYIGALLDPQVDLNPREVVRPAGVSQEDVRVENLALMTTSQQKAMYVAFTRLGYTVTLIGSGAEVRGVVENSAADGVLMKGDIIVAVEGSPVEFVDEAVKLIGGRSPGTEILLRVDRTTDTNQKPTRIDIPIVLGAFTGVDENGDPINDPDRGMIGVLLANAATDAVFPLEVEIDGRNIGGPSAGLMFTLEIMNQLTDNDLTSGQTIAGTGTISRDGEVGAVGGIRQKVFSAIDAGAEYVLVPQANTSAAQEAADDDIEVVSVSTIDDAIAFLETLS